MAVSNRAATRAFSCQKNRINFSTTYITTHYVRVSCLTDFTQKMGLIFWSTLKEDTTYYQ